MNKLGWSLALILTMGWCYREYKQYEMRECGTIGNEVIRLKLQHVQTLMKELQQFGHVLQVQVAIANMTFDEENKVAHLDLPETITPDDMDACCLSNHYFDVRALSEVIDDKVEKMDSAITNVLKEMERPSPSAISKGSLEISRCINKTFS